MQLNFKKYGEAGSHLIILHGLFGMLDNWHTLATRFGAQYQVWTLDLRNHGRSPRTDDIDYKLMAADLDEFYSQNNISQAYVLGHSMGGKVAMQFALDYAGKVEKLIVADIAPKAYDDMGHNTEINALQKLDLDKITRRSDAEEALKPYIPLESTRQFLLKNLTREGDKYALKMNFESLARNYGKLSAAIESDHVYEGEALFIRGGNSKYILDADKPLILKMFPMATFSTIPGADHWVHAEAPDAFYEAVEGFLG